MSARQIGQEVATPTSLSTQAEQKRAWPHGTSAIPVRGPTRHTAHESTAGAGAGDVELRAAGDDVVACWLSSSCCWGLFCNFASCYLVRHFHVLHFHVLHFRRPDIQWKTVSLGKTMRLNRALQRKQVMCHNFSRWDTVALLFRKLRIGLLVIIDYCVLWRL